MLLAKTKSFLLDTIPEGANEKYKIFNNSIAKLDSGLTSKLVVDFNSISSYTLTEDELSGNSLFFVENTSISDILKIPGDLYGRTVNRYIYVKNAGSADIIVSNLAETSSVTIPAGIFAVVSVIGTSVSFVSLQPSDGTFYEPPTGVWTFASSTTPATNTSNEFVSGSHASISVEGGNGQHLYRTPFSGSGDFDVVFKVGYSLHTDDYSGFIFCLYNTSSQRSMGIGTNFVEDFIYQKWATNYFTFSAGAGIVRYTLPYNGIIYIRIKRVSGTYTFYGSVDDSYWIQVYSEASGTFLGDADAYGFLVDSAGVVSTLNTTVTFLGWRNI